MSYYTSAAQKLRRIALTVEPSRPCRGLGPPAGESGYPTTDRVLTETQERLLELSAVWDVWRDAVFKAGPADSDGLLLSACRLLYHAPVFPHSSKNGSSTRVLDPRGAFSRLKQRTASLVGVALLACLPSGEPKAPRVAPRTTLGIDSLVESATRPFAVSHVAPQGATIDDPTVFVVFNRAVRPLDPHVPVPDAFSLLPELEGHWEWVGSHGVTFVPAKGRLPRATSFELSIAKEVHSLEGESLETGAAFRFQTPLPRVISASPESWEHSVRPRTPLTLTFSQAVRAEALREHVVVRSSAGAIPIDVQQGSSAERLVVDAQQGWPLDSEVVFEITPEWKGKEGDLAASEAFRGSFRTYGPLTATVECHRNATGRCLPEGGLSLRLSNPVNALALSAAIRSSSGNLRVDREWEPEATTMYIDLGATLKPRDKFTIAVDSLRDEYGQPLRFIKHSQVEIADYRPAVRLGFSGDSFLLDQKSVAIRARNSGYEMVAISATLAQLEAWTKLPENERVEAVFGSPLARPKRVAVGTLNQWSTRHIALDELTQSGPFVVALRYPDETGRLRREVRWGQRTNLGLTLKSGRERAFGWVTRLDTGEPVEGASLSVFGDGQKGSRSDALGVLSLAPGQLVSTAGEDEPVTWFSVQSGEDVLYRSTNDRIDQWRIPVDTGFWGKDEDIALLFPERDLFRPGDRAWIKGYVRRPVSSGTVPVQGERFVLRVRGPSGEKVQELPVQSSTYGAFAAALEIPRSAALGYWTLELFCDKNILTSSTIRVAEYRPSEFEVAVRSRAPQVIAGEINEWDLSGTYFFGGPMAGAQVETSLRREPAVYRVPGWEAFVTDDQVWQNLEPYRPYDVHLETKIRKLDEQGMLRVSSSTSLEQQTGPERLEFEATVSDLSAQTVSARGHVLVHPGAVYPAMEPLPSSLVDAPSSISPRVWAVSPEGKALDKRAVALSLYRVRWTHVQHAASGDAMATASEAVKELVGKCGVSSAVAGSSCALNVPHSGTYVLRATTTDEQGRAVSSSMEFYALGGGGVAAWRSLDEQGSVALTTDRKKYEVGQVARILVQSPFAKARAWITVERNGVLLQRVETLVGPSPSIRVPITADMRPNAFVGVHLLEDRKAMGPKAHSIADSYRFGYTELRLDSESRRLQIDISADKKTYRPRDEVSLSLRVRSKEGRGRRAEVAVFVVDEGVLSLSGYQLPDPLETFLRARPLRVETLESRESTARVLGFEPAENENKGAPGGGGDGERTNLLTAAYFNPQVVTDSGGNARVEFVLPDNIGRFRVMAVAVSEDDYFGTGRTDLTVNQPLMIRPALPRFLRAGDRFDAAAVITRLGGGAAEVSVAARAEGMELSLPQSQTIHLGDEGAGVVRFGARTDRAGEATLHFSAKSGDKKDAVALVRPVRSPAQIETVALYGKTDSAEAHRLGDLRSVRSDGGGLAVTLSSSALVGLSGSFEQLWDYPYLCTEQLASRALPLLSLRDLAAVYGVERPKDANKRIAESVALLIQRQQGDGGFGMWPESPASHPWVSAYALWVLREADTRGVTVGKQLFVRGVRYLRDVAEQRERDQLSQAVFAAFVLGRLGHSDPSTLHALFDRLDELTVEAQILLLWAASEAGIRHIEQVLVPRIEALVTVRGNAAEISAPTPPEAALTLASRTRRLAFALQALLAARPQHFLAPALVRGLLDAREGGAWSSTQESAFALLALDAYRKAQEHHEPQFEALVFLNDKLLGRRRFVGRDTRAQEFSVAMKELVGGGDLIFQQKGRGELFFEARLDYARNELPTTPLERGFSVEKTMMGVPPASRTAPRRLEDQREWSRGELVLVELLVVAPTQRRFVVVDDPLPAGLEAIDPNLTTSQSGLRDLLGKDAEGYTEAWYRSEVRDDRVLFFVDDMPPGVYRYRYLARATTSGQFITPFTRVMEMYQPEVYGRTAARHVVVRREGAQGSKP